jgi:glutathione synthase/RimK-type ligase-like ATP-grasp enzyme
MSSQRVSVALATSRQVADLWAGDRLLLEQLRSRGVRSAPVVWNDGAVNWREWDGVLIRSCWDYHLHAAQFSAWLDRLERDRIPLMNAPALMRWNLHKRYLLDVADRGARIPATRLVRRGSDRSLGDEIRDADWPATVIKPAIAASGYGARVIEGAPTPEDERAYASLLAAGDVLLQVFIPDIATAGEWSLVFFEGRYSHAVLKRAARGEFRVQIEWGGRVERAEPAREIIADAQAVIDALESSPIYARVDGIELERRLTIMEVELIEPELFFDRYPDAAARLADAVIRAVRESPDAAGA